MKILIVEDDERIASALREALAIHNFIVNVAANGQTAWELAEAFEYDLMILDVVVPKIDGISLCRRLRSKGYQIPILLLTAKDSSLDKVIGLDAGADDYVVKPFNLSELVARIRALLRRGSSTLSSLLTWENLQLDPISSDVTYAGKRVARLTPKEYSILKLFLCNPQRVFSRSAILDRLWDIAESPGEGTVTTHIKSLRQKLKAAGAAADFVETLHGVGYRLKPLSERDKSAPESSRSPSDEAGLNQSQQKVLTSIAKMWDRAKDSFIEQIEVIEQAVTALLAGKLDSDRRHRAQQEAHKLVGGLGIFSVFEGSKLARQIDHLLLPETNLGYAQAQQLEELLVALQAELRKTPSVSVPQLPASIKSTRILAIDDDAVLTEQIKIEATARGMHLDVAPNLQAAREAIAQTSPDVLLLDLSFPSTTESGLTILVELGLQKPEIPVIVFTSRDSLADRVEAARQGARAFLQKPVSSKQVVEVITQVLDRANTNQVKVTLVSDDPQVLTTLPSLLEPWGIQVTTLEQPQRFLDVISVDPPNLLVLDLGMPDFSGIDLCRVVRNDQFCGDMPILFLTERTDADTIRQMFAAGADDYICKPIV